MIKGPTDHCTYTCLSPMSQISLADPGEGEDLKRPHVYLRKSRVFRDQQTISPEMQLDECRRYAEAFGDSDLVVLEDSNVSGRRGRSKRPAFNRLLQAIEADEVSAIYSYNLSRLSRSVRDIEELVEQCAGAKIPIRLARDADPDPSTASGRALIGMLSVMAQFEADVASERARDAVEARRSRGAKLGPAYFEDTGAVVDAMRRSGSMAAAARLLTAENVPTKAGGTVWWPSTVRNIVQRTAPELASARAQRRAKRSAAYLFDRLLRCHCGQTLTGVRYARQNGYVLYRCLHSSLTDHGPKSVPESVVRVWAIQEVSRLEAPVLDKETALLERRGRLGRAYADGAVGGSDYAAGMAEVERDLMMERGDVVGSVRWDRDTEELNQQLHTLWEYVQLDEQQRPQFARWRGWQEAATPIAMIAR